MRRPFQVAAVSWVCSALVHGASLVLFGLCDSGADAPRGVATVDSVDFVLTLASEGSGEAAVRFAAFEALLPPEPVAAPRLLETAPFPSEPPARSAALQPASEDRVAAQAPRGVAIAETQLFGVRGRGNRFVYVFDRSSSMEGLPLAAAKRELLASLAALGSANQFQLIFYNQQPQSMPALRGAPLALSAADELGKRQAASFVGSIYADGATDHMAALRTALAMRPDVVFLLTDANEPRLQPNELQAIRQLNRGTVIHAIEFGAGPSSGPVNFLQQLAMDHGGEHTYIDVTRLTAMWR